MKPHYHDNHIANYNQDFRTNELPDNLVQCVVTSPPYWGLRKYSGEQDLLWGGDKDCGHEWITKEHRDTRGVEGSNLTGRIPYKEGEARINYSDGFCSLGGAWRGAYGLEPTPELYVQHTIEILREIRRVLRKDGVVFWNIGDSYWGGKGQSGQPMSAEAQQKRHGRGESINQAQHQMEMSTRPQDGKHNSLKPKDLCLIPFRIAIAAQTDGWWVRSIIIWNKPNPMPESVKDRPTESHEYILMLTKNARYYWDQEAVREPVAPSTIGRGPVDFGGAKGRDYQPDKTDPNFRNGSEQWGRTYDYTQSSANGRNLRSVWSFPTQPYPEAHFAVFPEKLPELCIKAATPEVGCCSKCGAPWERIKEPDIGGTKGHSWHPHIDDLGQGNVKHQTGKEYATYKRGETLGWQPTCKCNADKVPSIVLDPFAGAGTTLWVAKKLNRKAIGFDTSEEYCQLAVERLRQQVMI